MAGGGAGNASVARRGARTIATSRVFVSEPHLIKTSGIAIYIFIKAMQYCLSHLCAVYYTVVKNIEGQELRLYFNLCLRHGADHFHPAPPTEKQARRRWDPRGASVHIMIPCIEVSAW